MAGMHRLRVRDVMSAPVITVREDAPLKQVITTLLDHSITAAPVVDAEGELVGIVTEADLLSRPAYGPGRSRPLQLVAQYFMGIDPQWPRKAEGLTAKDVMTHAVVTVSPRADVHDAARRMLEQGIKSIVVVDDSRKIVGIVARRDVLSSFAPPDEQVVVAVDRVLHDIRWVPESIDVEAKVAAGIVTLDGSVLHPSDRKVVDAAVRAVPGVVDVVDRLGAREPEPTGMRP
jgi:CBS-domain-containing membrane protein